MREYIRYCNLFLWYYIVHNDREAFPYHYIMDDFGQLVIVADPWDNISYNTDWR